MEENQLQQQVHTELASEPTPQSEKSHFTYLFIAIAILGVIFLGGTYWLIVSQKSASPAPAAVKNTVVEHQKDLSDIEAELDQTEEQDIEKDFVQVDQEMKNL